MSPNHKMGVFSAACVVVANMIGTGVFTSLGFQLQALRDPFAVLMLWCVGAVLALSGALVYGELGAAMPRSGGEYHYLSKTYSPAVGFMSGWVSITVGFAAPVALSCMAFGSYLNRVVPAISPEVLALSILAVTTAVHCLGFRGGILFQNAFTVFKIVLIVLFILFGLFLTGQRVPVSFVPQASSMRTLFGSAFAVSLIYVSYSFSGWNASTYVAGELDQPQRHLPVSLWTGTAVVALLYIGLNATFLATAPMPEMAGQVDVAFVPARRLLGALGGKVMAAVIAVLLVSSVSSMVFVGPRITQVMGEDIRLFRFFAKKSAGGLPVAAILFQSLISLVLIVTSGFETVLTYVGFTLNLFTLLTVVGVFVHRFRYPDIPRPYKTWGFPVTPVVFIVFLTWMQVYLVLERPVQACLGMATALLGLAVYAFERSRRRQPHPNEAPN
jgi:APA family basic amino acid/polyamine antiporter